MSWIKSVGLTVATILIGLGLPLLLFEVGLRFLPVPTAVFRGPVTPEQPISHYQQDSDVAYSLGWNFYQRSKNRTNNFGLISAVDFVSGANPKIVVIGDSFAEAIIVNPEESFSGRLIASGVDPVYNIAMSGSALSQYVAFLSFAEREFNPEKYVVIVVGNDFDESLCSVRRYAGQHCYEQAGVGFRLELIESNGDSIAKRLFKSSALVRYVFFNLNAEGTLHALMSGSRAAGGHPAMAGFTDYAKSADVERLSYLVTKKFLSDVRAIVKQKAVTFVVDADRTAIYEGREETGSYFHRMRTFFKKEASANGFGVVDMDPVFRSHFSVSHEKFDFPTDGHWNALGHALAAKAYLDSSNSHR